MIRATSVANRVALSSCVNAGSLMDSPLRVMLPARELNPSIADYETALCTPVELQAIGIVVNGVKMSNRNIPI